MKPAPRNHLQRVWNVMQELPEKDTQEVIAGLRANINHTLENTRLVKGWSLETEAIIQALLIEAVDAFIADLVEASTPPVQVAPVEIEKQVIADGRIYFNIIIDGEDKFSTPSGANAQIAKRVIDKYRQRIAELENENS